MRKSRAGSGSQGLMSEILIGWEDKWLRSLGIRCPATLEEAAPEKKSCYWSRQGR